MTINQIKKQIATAEKNIAKFKSNVDRYMTRRDNAIAKANKKGIAITADDFHVDNADGNNRMNIIVSLVDDDDQVIAGWRNM